MDDALTIRAEDVFLEALLLEKQDGLHAARRDAFSCSAQASGWLRSPAPPDLPRALPDLHPPLLSAALGLSGALLWHAYWIWTGFAAVPMKYIDELHRTSCIFPFGARPTFEGTALAYQRWSKISVVATALSSRAGLPKVFGLSVLSFL